MRKGKQCRHLGGKIINLYEKQKARTTIRRKNCLIHVDSYEESLWEKGRHLGGKNIDKSVWERRRIIFSGLAGYATLDDVKSVWVIESKDDI